MGKEKTSKSSPKPETADPKAIWWWILRKGTTTTFLCISLFAILLRFCVSLHPYSGAGTPPKYGDFEAQRHWMEITTNLPVKEWYFNSSNNDLRYWGLDYPPLTAYQSYFHGIFLRFFDPESVALHSSRGYESYFGKLLMRWTVLSSDVLIFFPAVLSFITVYYSGRPSKQRINIGWHTAMVLLNPCLVLIDHGHFQYNCISLGLTVAAVAAILSDRDIIGSIFFCLALNHKQMSAYFAPAFFSYLLGKCLRRKNSLLEVLKLGLAVIGTFAVVWWPYLTSPEAIFQVLSRLAPFERGIYEDYVANFWCTTSILIKWKRMFATQLLKLLSLSATVFTCLPSMLQLIREPREHNFLYGLLNSALAFYLFSFQVHEKSILLPLLPASLLAMEDPLLFQWLTQNALLSMFPLLCRDKLILPYIALYGLFILLYYAPGGRRSKRDSPFSTVRMLVLACSLLLHVVYLTATPPANYPFLFEAFIMLLCFSQFVIAFLYSNTKQRTLLKSSTATNDGKKHL